MDDTNQRGNIRVDLEYEKTIGYISENFDLSLGRVISNVDFTKGKFFLEVPKGALIDNKYDFWGNILFQEEGKDEIVIGGQNFRATILKTTKDALSDFVFNYLQNNKDRFGVFDDIVLCYDFNFMQKDHSTIICEKSVSESYYFVDSTNNRESIGKAVSYGSYAWHSLKVLTSGVYKQSENWITDNAELLMNADYILFGAYDGQSFIYWERIQE